MNGSTPRRRVLYGWIDSLEAPPGVTRAQLAGVKRVLRAIVSYYPKAHPSQESIAAKAGMGLRSAERYVALARGLGLLDVTPFGGVGRPGKHFRTHRYHIMLAGAHTANLAGSLSAKLAGKASSDTDVSDSAEDLYEIQGRAKPQALCAFTEEEENTLPRKTLSEALAAAESAGRKSVRKKASAGNQGPDWQVLSYLGEKWESLVYERPELGDVRLVDSMRLARNYLNAHFFGQLQPRSVRWVCEQIDLWAQSVLEAQIILTPSDSAFRNFTNWWGRSSERPQAVTPDEADEYFSSQRLTKGTGPA